MKQLWTEERAEYHGKYVDFGPSYAWPKPQQKPHPPVHVGGARPARDPPRGPLRRRLGAADGRRRRRSRSRSLPRLREALAAAGRDAARFEVSIYFCPPDPAVVGALPRGGHHARALPGAVAARRRPAAGARRLREAAELARHQSCTRKARWRFRTRRPERRRSREGRRGTRRGRARRASYHEAVGNQMHGHAWLWPLNPVRRQARLRDVAAVSSPPTV